MAHGHGGESHGGGGHGGGGGGAESILYAVAEPIFEFMIHFATEIAELPLKAIEDMEKFAPGIEGKGGGGGHGGGHH